MKSIPLNVAKIANVVDIQLDQDYVGTVHCPSPRKKAQANKKGAHIFNRYETKGSGGGSSSSPRDASATTAASPPSSSSSITHRTIRPNPQYSELMMEATEIQLKSRKTFQTRVNGRGTLQSLTDESVELHPTSSPVFTDQDPGSPERTHLDPLMAFEWPLDIDRQNPVSTSRSSNVAPDARYLHREGKCSDPVHINHDIANRIFISKIMFISLIHLEYE